MHIVYKLKQCGQPPSKKLGMKQRGQPRGTTNAAVRTTAEQKKNIATVPRGVRHNQQNVRTPAETNNICNTIFTSRPICKAKCDLDKIVC